MKQLQFSAIAAAFAIALSAASGALAASPLHVGIDDDGPVWGNPAAEMDMVRFAGADTFRATLQWTTGETAPDPAHVQLLETAAFAARVRGIEPVVAVYQADWHSTPADAASRADFAAFLAAAAAQLPDVSTFIVGNEPNSGLYWRPQFDANGGDAAAPAYEQLLAAGYDAIKSVRPDATVVGGALDPRGTDNPTGTRPSQSPTVFIRDLGAAYRASGRTTPLMDVWDQHVYADNSSLPPSMPHLYSGTVTEADYGKLVTLLGAAFDGTAQQGTTLPIVYGEYGAETTIPPNEAGSYSGAQPKQAPTIDEATQAAYYIQALKIAACQPTVIGLDFFHLYDESSLGGLQTGLFFADGHPKSSLLAVRAASAAARAGALTTCPDASPPSVALATPNGDGTVTVIASDDIGVGRVELTVDGRSQGLRYAPPYTFSWSPPAAGSYVLTARAYDVAGNLSTATLDLSATKNTRNDAAASLTGWTFHATVPLAARTTRPTRATAPAAPRRVTRAPRGQLRAPGQRAPRPLE